MAASRTPRARLLHIRDGIDGVAGALSGVTYEQYRNSYVLRRTVERAVQIISEAVKALPADLLTRYPYEPWHAISGIGNILRYEYQTVDDKRMWDIAVNHLPKLRPVVAAILTEHRDQN
jgi:uncharacterized protein with HEPN domain